MRRATVALLGTALGTTLMIGAKLGNRPSGTDVALGQMDPVPGLETSASADPGMTPAASTTATAGPGQPSAPAATPGTRPTTGTPVTTAAAPPGSGLKNGTFAGPPVTQRYGTIKVTVVVSGGKITDVTATYPTDGESGSINNRAIPLLRREVLAAQSASIATISGATYTSNAYKQSLAAAIAAAKA